jgi:DNA repair protein RadD
MLDKLRYYQREQHDAIFNYYANGGRGNPLIAAPTGTGKSMSIAAIFYSMLTNWPHVRGLMCTHVKELVKQNAEEIWKHWSQAPVGIFSSGLKRREFVQPILFCGIGSIANNLDLLGHRDFMVIDEAHLVPPKVNTRYQRVIAHFKARNPNFTIIGLSATIFRLGQGKLTEELEKGNRIFTDIVCDQTTPEWFAKFIAEGFMSPLVSKRTKLQLDINGVTISNGELNQTQLQNRVDIEAITQAALEETMHYGEDRKCWLVFASGIEHAEHIASMLNTQGVPSAAVHSDKTRISEGERDRRLIAFKEGKIRALVCYRMYTTGHNNQMIDLIVDLYPTVSAALHVQKYGRGTRPYRCAQYTKQNCLVLDFSGNTKRLGPIDDPLIPKPKGGTVGTAPIKICTACSTYNHISKPVCDCCGSAFSFKTKITETAAELPVMSTEPPVVHWYDVGRVIYNLHTKEYCPDSIKVNYLCPQGGQFNEYVCPMHTGFARHRALEWWRQRFSIEPPETTREWLQHLSKARVPSKIRVHVNKKYPEILSCEF